MTTTRATVSTTTPDFDDDDTQPMDLDAGDDDDDSMRWLHAETGPAPGIFDSKGRQVILRGPNFNHLGDYFETDPSLPTVAKLGPDDWDDAAALGTNVVRLVTSWSFWEPERGAFNEDYLQRVRDAVADAAARDIYVVIDIHQDAWSKFVFTPADDECPRNASPGRLGRRAGVGDVHGRRADLHVEPPGGQPRGCARVEKFLRQPRRHPRRPGRTLGTHRHRVRRRARRRRIRSAERTGL
ncbi:MAG: cellulase family glycosylhydrolase [Deltaproteobacteria bacterium]|nr:cellulase family glycosylhydrolase [Deltaproteobacteria bacterium]